MIMKKEEIEEIKIVIDNYRDEKLKFSNAKKELEKRFEEKLINVWQMEMQINDLYVNLFKTKECIRFLELSNRAETDSQFEKYFRAFFFKAFYNLELDPEKL